MVDRDHGRSIPQRFRVPGHANVAIEPADRQARPERQGTLPECDATRLRSLRLLQRRVVWSGKVDPCERKRRDQQDRAPVEVSHRHPACYRGFVAAGAHRSRAGRVGLVTNPLPPLRRRYATTCDVPHGPFGRRNLDIWRRSDLPWAGPRARAHPGARRNVDVGKQGATGCSPDGAPGRAGVGVCVALSCRLAPGTPGRPRSST